MNRWQIVPTGKSFRIPEWLRLVDECPELSRVPPPKPKSRPNPFKPGEILSTETSSTKTTVNVDIDRIRSGVITWLPDGHTGLNAWPAPQDSELMIPLLESIAQKLNGDLREPRGRPLHNAFTTAFTVDEAVSTALNFREAEMDLTASHHFFDFDGDWNAVTSSYDAYFQDTVESLSAKLGKPDYHGRWDAEDRQDWEYILPEYADAHELVVWSVNRSKLHFRYSWEDKEIPILLTIGIAGCAATGEAFPGQFD